MPVGGTGGEIKSGVRLIPVGFAPVGVEAVGLDDGGVPDGIGVIDGVG